MCFTQKGGVVPPAPNCPICYGRGYIIIATFSRDFGPGTATERCPKCDPYEHPQKTPWLRIILGMAIFIALIVALNLVTK